MAVIWKIKAFNELTLVELYQVLELRSEVFVVEQDCVYQDIDGKDPKALHLLGIADGKVVAYSRLFDAGIYFETTSIGRVVVAKEYRAQKLGHTLIHKGIEGIRKCFNKESITISAQYYLLHFYRSHGFESVGQEYLEDGIPHIKMVIR